MKNRMMMFLGIFALLSVHPGSSRAELSEAEFNRLHTELRPADHELWRTIPWKTSVLEAQHAAGEQRKPLFIWAMDGHPLGCT